MENLNNVIDLPVTSYSERVAEVSERGLDNIIRRGTAQAARVVDHVLGERPRDALVKAPSLNFSIDGENGLKAAAGDRTWSFHDHALSQLSERVEAPAKYVRELRNGALKGGPVWQSKLLVDILNDHTANHENKLLFRDINGEARGVLSDSYKRLAAAPMVENFFQLTKELGAVPSGGFFNDVRFYLRALYPFALKISNTETICLGIQLKTSDYGAGVYELDPFCFRSTCLNTAQYAPALSHKHLGAKISEFVEQSEETVRLDTAHVISASKDVIRGVLSEDSRQSIVASLREKNETAAEFGKFRGRIQKALGKGLATKVEEAFESNDVINLPPEKTVYRLSNALTWVAQHIKDADTADQAERLAGTLLAA